MANVRKNAITSLAACLALPFLDLDMNMNPTLLFSFFGVLRCTFVKGWITRENLLI